MTLINPHEARDWVLPRLLPAGSHSAQAHNRLIELGAICTSYDNLYVSEFEDEYPEPVIDDFADALSTLSAAWDPEIHHCDNLAEEELRMAAAEISRRMAGRVRTEDLLLPPQNGSLTDATALKPGDLIDLSRFWTEYTAPPAKTTTATATYFIVTENLGRAAGEVIVRTEGGPLVIPHGTLVPVILS